jgi:serine protease Do
MKKWGNLFISILFMIGMIYPAFGYDVEDSVRKSMDNAIAKVKPALVRIHVVSLDYWAGREMKEEASGSGFIISPDGYIVTNHHVAGHASRIMCTLSDKREIPAELIGTDALSDIAVIRLKPAQPCKFPYVNFGDSNKVMVGDRVLAMGSPWALSQSVTKGIVSNTEMVMPKFFWPFSKFTMDGEDVGSIIRWIGHDADIAGGNSGGPLVNLKGEIIGVNEMEFALSGAIPSNTAKEVSEKLIKAGKVQRAWIGLEVQPRLKAMNMKEGVLVSGILSDSPSSKAGFLSGDILLSINNQPVNVSVDEELPLFNHLICNLPFGKEISAQILRNNEKKDLKLVPQEREEMRPKTYELKEWGFTARNISLMAAKEMKLKTRDGVIISSTREGGPADDAKPSLKEKVIITKVNDTSVNTVQDLIKITRDILKDKTDLVPVLVSYKDNTEERLTVVKIGIKELEDPGAEIKKAWLPLSFQVLTRELAEQLGLDGKKGVRVTQVYHKNSAEKAGIKVGDIILAIDGDEISASLPEDYEVLPTMIRQYKIGSTAELTIIRDKNEIKIPVELVPAPKQEREMPKYKDEKFDFTVRDITYMDVAKDDVKEGQTGVVVTEVKEGGWAALGLLGSDDLIVEADSTPITKIEDIENKMKEIQKNKPQHVTFKVLRGIHTLYLEFEPDWTDKK